MAPASILTQTAKEYWDAAAETYEQDFAGTLIGQTRRKAVWDELDCVFRPGQRILELNCGTGLDAVHLGEGGIRVLACDISPRMIELARQRTNKAKLDGLIEFRPLATEEINVLLGEGPFDGAFSNFSGLNCVEDVSAVAQDLGRLLKPGAPFLLGIIGRFVPWEIVWFLARGDPRKAVRRFRGHMVRPLEAGTLVVQYFSVKEMANLLAPQFKLRKWKGIGICVPPSYLEPWARRFPRLTKALAEFDGWFGSVPILRSMADYALLEFERNMIVSNRDGAA
ncbi:MAG TPA: class I SAM-dependent methyltransferase [Terriglobia bacterium]|nr:class I SAM-dependent methyltransferase [Terriglobia bacterium]